jgi:hypothetical protein
MFHINHNMWAYYWHMVWQIIKFENKGQRIVTPLIFTLNLPISYLLLWVWPPLQFSNSECDPDLVLNTRQESRPEIDPLCLWGRLWRKELSLLVESDSDSRTDIYALPHAMRHPSSITTRPARNSWIYLGRQLLVSCNNSLCAHPSCPP